MATKQDVLCELIKEAAQERELEVVTYLSLQLAKVCSGADKAINAAPVQGILCSVKTASPAVIYRFTCEYLRRLSPNFLVRFSDIAINVESDVISSPGFDLDRTWHEKERRERWRNHVSQAIEALRKQGILVKSDKNRIYKIVRLP